jgi:predicted ATP-dependent endonuclease of OLD family
MKLEKVFIGAFKSIVNAELDVKSGCIGLVGINESGKSNVLKAIKSLSASNGLREGDVPKKNKKSPASLRFEFCLSSEEIESIKILITKSLHIEKFPKGLLPQDVRLSYHVEYDPLKRQEKRYFTIPGIKLPSNFLVLSKSALTKAYKCLKGEEFIPLEEVIVITEEELKINEELSTLSSRVTDIEEEIEVLQKELSSFMQTNNVPSESETAQTQFSENNKVIKYKSQIDQLEKEKSILIKKLGDFDVEAMIGEREENEEKIIQSIEATNKAILEIEKNIVNFPNLVIPEEQRKQYLEKQKKTLQENKSKLSNILEQKESIEEELKSLNQPLKEKFSSDLNSLSEHITTVITSIANQFLPKVIFWEYKEEYILKGEYQWDTLLNSNSLIDIPRPLHNIFRIAFKIDNIEEFKIFVTEIKEDSSERRRKTEEVNRSINQYIKKIWEEYDQKLDIAFEQEKILIKFYDPKFEGASFFEMRDRSQGCQTFISFLLTIGAEAKNGLIQNDILLLDEPETHLHPSGVRYMLKELQKASEKRNIVIFATHSIFMIDREKYENYIIVKKEQEITSLERSSRNRIGYFLQEEVLYHAMSIDPYFTKEDIKKNNFVFEGDGDATLFKHYVSYFQKKNRDLFNGSSSFYHGGKCSDIKKTFTHYPILLGSKWFFVLDNDKPASELKNFLLNKYSDFISRYIFIIQYNRKDMQDCEIQLEDMLPEYMLKESIEDACKINEFQNASSFAEKVDNKEAFSKYFLKISDSLPDEKKDNFKKDMKKILNEKIEMKLTEIKKKEMFEEQFKEYTMWANEQIQPILQNNGQMNPKVKKEAPFSKT